MTLSVQARPWTEALSPLFNSRFRAGTASRIPRFSLSRAKMVKSMDAPGRVLDLVPKPAFRHFRLVEAGDSRGRGPMVRPGVKAVITPILSGPILV